MNVELFREMLITYGLKVIYALVVFLIGLRVIKVLKRPIQKAFEKSNIDEAVQHFLNSLVSALLKVLLVIVVASMVGVETTSLVAVIGAASFAVGLALQGSLSNFAGGVLILVMKPFEVGDFIEAQGYAGTVKEIHIFYTNIVTPDHKMIVIPNGALSNTSSVNYSKMATRRVDLVFGVGYESDIQKVKDVVLKVITNHELIHKDPDPFIRLAEHGDSALGFKVRVWCDSANYWKVYFDLMEEVKEAFDEAGINIPYPHVQVVKDNE